MGTLFELGDGDAIAKAREILVNSFGVSEDDMESLLFNMVQYEFWPVGGCHTLESDVLSKLMVDPFIYKTVMLLFPGIYEYFRLE